MHSRWSPGNRVSVADYDHFVYDNFPFAETHPDVLATLARLFGLEPAPPGDCRVLEIGCGLGGNLLGMAVALPGSSFVGIDLSVRQIDRARADAARLGLPNIDFFVADVAELGDKLGEFDYLICHGVYSWVEPAAQAAILQAARTHLASHGVAFVSYNALPGWHLRGAIRDMLRREVGDHGTPVERVARARDFLRFLGEHGDQRGNSAAAWLLGELQMLEELSDRYLYYEYLVERNEPLFFEDFVARARGHGLQYLADAEFRTMLPDQYGPGVTEAIAARASGLVRTEQHLDYLSTRYFRRSLLCHRERPLDRTLRTDRLAGLWISTPLSPVSETPDVTSDAEEEFQTDSGAAVTTGLPLVKAALLELCAARPKGVRLDELQARAAVRLGRTPTAADEEALAASLLEGYARGYIRLSTIDRPYVLTVSDRPCTTPLVRLQAGRDDHGVTNLRHESIGTDTLDRVLLELLDGTRDRSALLEGVLAGVASGRVRAEDQDGQPVHDPDVFAELIDLKLPRLARNALLIG